MTFLNPPKADVRRRRILIGGASLLLTTLVMTAFLLESRSGYSKPDPKLIFVQNWRSDRTREQAIADQKATRAVQEAKMAESRRYIATLRGDAKVAAQEQYEKYITGGGADKEVPYVAATPVPVVVEPPVQ
ncbi:MAG: hypothetical protein H7267_03340 [Sandarakinorhabdus sp.]|nr:hypothetical protein [Sandarakinorhabdus sp.]